MLDVVVVGGGYVGLSVAVSIKQAAPHLSVEVIEAAPEDAWKKDLRASAIISAATKMLDVFGVWDRIEPDAQPINRMIVTDSKTSDPVRPVFLTFDGAVEDGRPFAHMIPNSSMRRSGATKANSTAVLADWSVPIAKGGLRMACCLSIFTTISCGITRLMKRKSCILVVVQGLKV